MACETKARLAIRSVLLNIAAPERVLGMAGGADGGDILFHEVCEELGIQSEVCLALPATEYVHTSVQASWAARFHRLLKTHPSATLESFSGNVWLRDQEWQLRRARERHPSRIILVALLETEERDVLGGTSRMVHMAQACGVEVIRLDPCDICK
jgi:hypothetical protein